MRHKTLISRGLAAVLAICLLSTNSFGFSVFSRYKHVSPVGGLVHIKVAQVDDGKAHYYTYEHDNKEIKFFLVKSRDGEIRAAFDACDVCFHSRKGYDQENEFMICNNCGMKFHSSRINVVEGGCNPAPLNRKRVGD